MTQTFHFNTGRKYTAKGQRITFTIHDDGKRITFWDHDRIIDGEIDLSGSNLLIRAKVCEDEAFARKMVLQRYDAGEYVSTVASWQDGCFTKGCNVKFEEA